MCQPLFDPARRHRSLAWRHPEPVPVPPLTPPHGRPAPPPRLVMEPCRASLARGLHAPNCPAARTQAAMGLRKGRDGMVWTVRAGNGRTAQWTFSKRAKPFVLGPGNWVPGLAMPGGGFIFPLDAGLRWIDLSPAGREAALRARPAQRPFGGWSQVLARLIGTFRQLRQMAAAARWTAPGSEPAPSQECLTEPSLA